MIRLEAAEAMTEHVLSLQELALSLGRQDTGGTAARSTPSRVLLSGAQGIWEKAVGALGVTAIEPDLTWCSAEENVSFQIGKLQDTRGIWRGVPLAALAHSPSSS